MSFFAPFGCSKSAANAGLNVRELNAEMMVDTEMVMANCLKNWPVIPLMNAQGIKTAHKTKATAMTGPVTSVMAFRAASRGESPSCSQRSTFSTTTIASSTTMPMASTKPNSDRLFKLKPRAAIAANVPTTATGTAIRGMRVARHVCKNINTTSATRMIASLRVLKTSMMESLIKGVVS